MNVGLAVLLVALVLATAFGVYRRLTDGRIRGVDAKSISAPPPANDFISAGDLGAQLGDRATLVQFSSAFCQPCRAARRVLDEVSEMVDGVSYIEIDAESHLDLVRQHSILRTPTIFILDSTGRVQRRVTGAPRKVDVIAALGEVIP